MSHLFGRGNQLHTSQRMCAQERERTHHHEVILMRTPLKHFQFLVLSRHRQYLNFQPQYQYQYQKNPLCNTNTNTTENQNLNTNTQYQYLSKPQYPIPNTNTQCQYLSLEIPHSNDMYQTQSLSFLDCFFQMTKSLGIGPPPKGLENSTRGWSIISLHGNGFWHLCNEIS